MPPMEKAVSAGAMDLARLRACETSREYEVVAMFHELMPAPVRHAARKGGVRTGKTPPLTSRLRKLRGRTQNSCSGSMGWAGVAASGGRGRGGEDQAAGCRGEAVGKSRGGDGADRRGGAGLALVRGERGGMQKATGGVGWGDGAGGGGVRVGVG